MTRYDLIARHEDVLRECARAGISVQDWRNAEIYRFIQKLRSDGNKMDYCINQAMIRYVISEATAWRIWKSMQKPLTIML